MVEPTLIDVPADLKPSWVSENMWPALWRRDEGRCLACFVPLDDACPPSVHHLVPRAKGGTTTYHNLVLLCHRCHDRVEQAQEAMLAAWNMPPTRNRLMGIFVKALEAIAPFEDYVISPNRSAWHAERLIELGKRHGKHRVLNLIKVHRQEVHRQRTHWAHVDWLYLVERMREEWPDSAKSEVKA